MGKYLEFQIDHIVYFVSEAWEAKTGPRMENNGTSHVDPNPRAVTLKRCSQIYVNI